MKQKKRCKVHRLEKFVVSKSLLNAFLGKFGRFCRTLTSLKLRVRLVDNVKRALSLNDLTVVVAAFHG